jgi:ribonucleoside-triphosphate reductase
MVIYKIRKRNGAIVSFDRTKIENAIKKAFEAVGETDFSVIPSLAKKAGKEVEKKIGQEIPDVEVIQDMVEQVLIAEGYSSVAKSYIIYRQKRSESRANRNVVVEVGNTMDEYLNQSDWRVNANSNQGYSLG